MSHSDAESSASASFSAGYGSSSGRAAPGTRQSYFTPLPLRPARLGGGRGPRGVVATYDPLSSRRGGVVTHNAEIARALVNTAHQLEAANRLRRRTPSVALPGTRPGDVPPHVRPASRNASQRAVDVAVHGGAEALPTHDVTKHQRFPLCPEEPGLMLLGDEPPQLCLSGVAQHHNHHNSDNHSSSRNNNSSSGGGEGGRKSALALIPMSFEKGQRKKTIRNLRNSDAGSGLNEEPVTWRPEWHSSNPHRGSALSHRTASCGVSSPSSEWHNAGELPVSSGPTLHHKQLTEAFYGNYTSGMLAQEAYLHFVSDINRRHTVGSISASSLCRQHRSREKSVRSRRQHSDAFSIQHESDGADFSGWPVFVTSERKWDTPH